MDVCATPCLHHRGYKGEMHTDVSRASTRRRVLVIDDEAAVRFILERVLRGSHDVTSCGSADDALAQLRGGKLFDVILCDLTMEGMSGIDLYRTLEASARELCDRMIFVTGGAFSPEVQR